MGSEKVNDVTNEISYADAMLEAARQSWQSGDLKKAETGLRLVIREEPDNLDAWTELCVLLLQQRRETEAELAGKQVLRIRGKKELTWARLRGELRATYVDKKPPTKIDTKLGGFQPAIEDSKDFDSDKEKVSYPNVTGEVSSIPLSKITSETKPKHDETEIPQSEPQERSADNWYEFGNLYMKQKKYHDAIRAFKKCIDIDPQHLEALVKLGETQFYQEEYAGAIGSLNRLLAMDSENAHAWYLLGMSHQKLGNQWDATQALYESVKIDDTFIDAWKALGISLAQQGRHVQAQKALLRALKNRRNDPDLLYEYAKSLKEEGKLARAENVLRMTVGVDPKSIEAWNLLGDVLMKLGKTDEARRVKGHARMLRSV
ncbi:MAG: tetratricopeptide repeat protein [Candidatus Thorarchaeota archaeon]